MSNPINKTSNLERLIQEKHQLQTFCAYQEKLIGYKFDEFKKNFPEIISNEILPYTQEKNRNITSLLDVVNEFVIRLLPSRYRSNRLTSIVLKLVQVMIIRGLRKNVRKNEL
jgi:hypothetical protein